MSKVIEEPDGCWRWTGYTQRNGYGSFGTGSRSDGTRRKVFAHRWAYEHFRGPIPEGTTLDHLCMRRNCVNPDHLEAVPHAVNLRRGNTIAARNAAVTHCPAGHPYEGENLVINSRGQRICRTCNLHKSRIDYYRKQGWIAPDEDLYPLLAGPLLTGDVICPKCRAVLFTNYTNNGMTSIECSGGANKAGPFGPHRKVMAMLRPYAAWPVGT